VGWDWSGSTSQRKWPSAKKIVPHAAPRTGIPSLRRHVSPSHPMCTDLSLVARVARDCFRMYSSIRRMLQQASCLRRGCTAAYAVCCHRHPACGAGRMRMRSCALAGAGSCDVRRKRACALSSARAGNRGGPWVSACGNVVRCSRSAVSWSHCTGSLLSVCGRTGIDVVAWCWRLRSLGRD
jgi:hypothetical protein